jgi:hypothetical protein
MSEKLVVLLNGVSQIEYDRSRVLPDRQREYLDHLDRRLDRGVELNGERIEQPDRVQRAQFVAVHMIHAIKSENEPLAAATCSYLADRLPDLKQVKADEDGEDISIDLVFDELPVNQVQVRFDSGHGGNGGGMP